VKRTVVSPSGLHWTVRRLVVPTGMRPLTRTELLQAATPGRTVVAGVDERLPDAVGAATGPYPLAFLFVPLLLPLLPFVLLLRAGRLLPWTLEARTYPWGRRFPAIVFSYAVRGRAESVRALDELIVALARGDGRPELTGADDVGEARSEFPPLRSFRGL
jgi:hypothetical protein